MESSFTPQDAVDLFGDLPEWWIAGGWAIDLWLGRKTREHIDLDVATLRTNQRAFWRRLDGWDLHLATAPGVLEPLTASGLVPSTRHAVWCRPSTTSPWAFEILLNDSFRSEWLFRRDHGVRQRLADIGRTSSDGIPYLAPEIVLLYKAKNVRANDARDFESALPTLSVEQRSWLRNGLEAVHPDHVWIQRLA